MNSNSAGPATRGGASWTTGSPRSSTRAISPASYRRGARNPRSSSSLSSRVKRCRGRLVLHQLERLEVARAPHVADDRDVAQPLQPGPQVALVGAHVVEHGVALEQLEVCKPDRAAHGVAPERDPVQERLLLGEERLGEEVADDHRAEGRVATGQALGHRDHVGDVLVTLGAEHVPKTTERADHLVRDQQHTVAVADLSDPLEVTDRRREAPARVLHRFEVHRRDCLRAFGHDRVVDRPRGGGAERVFVVGQWVAVPVGVGDVHDAGREWRERLAQRGDASDGEGAHGGAVVGGLAGDDLVALGLTESAEVLARQLPRRLHRLGATGGEEHPVEVGGRQRGQARREPDGGGVRVAPDREVRELLGLGAGGLCQLAATVAELHCEQARQAVEVPLPVLVEHVATVAPGDDGDVSVLVGRQPAEVHPEMPPGQCLEVVRRHARFGQI